jgi:UDPglucose 6-dehydrogenase
MAMPSFEKVFGNIIELAKNAHSALKGAECAIIMTEWDELKRLKPKDYLAYMREPNVIDARRIYHAEDFKELNLLGIGLGSSPEIKEKRSYQQA